MPGTGDGPIGSVAYDSTGSTVYVGTGNPSTPLYTVAYSLTTGYAAPSPVNVTSLNGAPATQLSGSNSSAGGNGGSSVNGGVNAMVIGPDNNIWIAEHDSRQILQYVAVAAIHSAVVNPITGATIAPGPGVFAEYTLDSSSSCCSPGGPPLHGIASMGGFIWVTDLEGDLWRINPTNGLVNPNLAVGYLPGQSSTEVGRVTDPSETTVIGGVPGSSNGYTFQAALVPLNGVLYIANRLHSSFDALSVDTSSSPSAGICTTPGPPPCIATFTQSLSGALTNPISGTTDGTSYYVLGDSTGNVLKITPPSTLTTSASAYTSYYGGLGISADGWIWTLTSSGVQALLSMTSSASPVSPTVLTACSTTQTLQRGALPFLAGPDGTWLFSPNYTASSSSTAAMLCAVVY